MPEVSSIKEDSAEIAGAWSFYWGSAWNSQRQGNKAGRVRR